jgi:hypothetical protein
MDTPTKYDNRHISAVPAAAFLASVVADTASPPPPPPPHNESPQISLLSFSQALNLRTISRPLPLHEQRFFFLPALSLFR